MDNRKNVTNWFDGEAGRKLLVGEGTTWLPPWLGPESWSYPGSLISDKAAAARGDVAAAVKRATPALVAMMERAMQRMTIESMLMQAGASEGGHQATEPNVLQGISKE